MNKLALLFPAALVATMASAQVRTPATPSAPTLTVTQWGPTVIWNTKNAYEVCITPGCLGELPPNGSVQLPSGTYMLTAIGERNRRTSRVVVVP